MNKGSKWKEIWEKRKDNLDEIDVNDKKAVFLELKRVDGFDVVGDGIGYDALIHQNDSILKRLSKYNAVSSIFDCGCGCGANIYMFENEGIVIGGIDYSSSLISIAQRLFGDRAKELVCGQALDMPTDIIYDSAIANSVFSYFPDEEYAEKVLDKLLTKTRNSIGLVDIHDLEKKDEFIAFRRKTIENYDERYKDLNKFFYSREFFKNWAEKNNLEIEFFDSDVEGYWNSNFVFDVYFYKK